MNVGNRNPLAKWDRRTVARLPSDSGGRNSEKVQVEGGGCDMEVAAEAVARL
ncbi:hypothetical protein E1A91_A07G100800v1 [Gossypium mustelinum]|uniref:Uncharacterized protein n=1 Tax=Gossypium mustelinum TaxID=34275 RepID=A0A5D2YJE0_GOSMU|nr:hypothetical protein E1A91_A07G100800v1 [Gossypium mustelinum]